MIITSISIENLVREKWGSVPVQDCLAETFGDYGPSTLYIKWIFFFYAWHVIHDL